MKQGLSLRVSQHLALTPQLQQSIRLLQLSTLELSQEVEQMLDDNPFLELNADEVPREEFGLERADVPVPEEVREAEYAETTAAPQDEQRIAAIEPDASPAGPDSEPPSWEGDGSTEVVPDDGEWGGDALPRTNNLSGDEDMDATDLARGEESLQSFLHRQVLALRLSEEDRCALCFLIESLNDDGYLDKSLESLAAAWRLTTPNSRRSWRPISAWRLVCCTAWSRRGSAPGRSLNACRCSSRRSRPRAMHRTPWRPRFASARSRWNCWRGAT
jgi:RNA polymerase sigma-54 factor